MKIYVGADHRGYVAKQEVLNYLKKAGYEAEDIGDEQFNPEDDFPVFATKAANKVLSSQDADSRAILICGSGQGMAMAANRFKGIRAGLGYNVEAAKCTRNDEDSNVLALPAELFKTPSDQKVFVIIEAWLNTPFANAARFIRRNQELDNL
ncbi:MAG TPA: RpiB/LacA/LacB family sugar-phosphate isomerase [Patescibacteria group bacterium]|nr:RpiB/LacA/LacB family sugar-phosphate isomerase [Patescibacteria group bacterium]